MYILNRNIYQIVTFKCELLFFICISIYFSIKGIRKYVIKRLYITYVAQVNDLVSSNDYNFYDEGTRG